MVMTSFLYRKISFTLYTLSLITFIRRIILEWFNITIFIEWNIGGRNINFTISFFIDSLRALFLTTVMFISANVVVYSQRYLREDIFIERFILLLLGFVISIIILIISPNIVSVLLGWDGLGLVSYCLVIYYPTKKSNSAGILTVLRNRVGDVCILIRIAWVRFTGEFNFLFWAEEAQAPIILSLLILFAAITKRAQIPFSAWLPAAIAAPTPVSALVHSSTLVTAGVYLLIRFNSFLDPQALNLLIVISVLTMFIAGIVACFEYDLKKIIALSTLRQLGIIIFAISLGLVNIALFHLIIHALFKALLFLCAGVLIHGAEGSQDLRFFGSFIKNFPLTATCINLANLSLCGLPFLSGFYSKDIIVELARQNTWNLFIIIIIFMRLSLTVYYTFRLSNLTFVRFSQGISTKLMCDNDYYLTSPIFLLARLALISGPSIIYLIFSSPNLIILPQIIKLLTLIIISLTIIWAIFQQTWVSFTHKSNRWQSIQGIMWGLPLISGQLFRILSLKLATKIIRSLELGWTEWRTIGSIKRDYQASFFIENFHKSNYKTFILRIIFWILLIIIYFN